MMKTKTTGSGRGNPSTGKLTGKERVRVTFKTAAEAKDVIAPTIRIAHGLMKARKVPHISGALTRLTGWMSRMEMGSKVDARTPIYKHQPRAKLVKEWGTILNRELKRWMRAFPSDAFALLVRVESDNAKNIGPQSMFLPASLDVAKRLKAVFSDKPPLDRLNKAALDAAFLEAETLCPSHSIHLIPFDEVLEAKSDPHNELDDSTNIGFGSWNSRWYMSPRNPAYSKRPQYAIDAQEWVIEQAHWLYDQAHKVSDWKSIVPRLVATTGQRLVQKGANPFKPNSKGIIKAKRYVDAMPKLETVAGKTVSHPLQLALRELLNPVHGIRVPLYPAWRSAPEKDKAVNELLRWAHVNKLKVLSGDISDFDATLPPWFIWRLAITASKWMDKPAATLFLALMNANVYHTSILYPGGFIPECPSSVKSGSIFTSNIGCLANYIIYLYGIHAGYYRRGMWCGMGDDYIAAGIGLTPEAMERTFADFGMSAAAEKSDYTVDCCTFLQRVHILDCPGGIYPSMRVLGKVLSMESDDDDMEDEDYGNPWVYTFQALARTENADFCPYFDKFVEYISRGDKRNSLGRNVPVKRIVSAVGDYATRRMTESQTRPWKVQSTGVPFEQWLINRVLRGEKLLSPGYSRFQQVYGTSYDSVKL